MNIRKSVARPVLGSLALMLAAALAGTALAQDRTGGSSKVMTVHYSDLNLSTTAGATTLYQRIVGAAHYVCGEEGYQHGIDMQNYWSACFQGAINDAVAKVHNPMLTKVAGKEHLRMQVTAMLTR